ncbi:MAG: methylated-DNA--[protein]-cysteine S-methyltransferase [Acidiferrobacterales bacterium]
MSPDKRTATARGFAVFDTAIGQCGIAWSNRGTVGIQLPEGGKHGMRAHLHRQFPDASEAAPPLEAQRIIDGIVALLRGEDSDLGSARLDMEGVPPFHRRVYESARAIPSGATRSYGDIAADLGSRGAARAVGQALGHNPFAIVVPCHRILCADGRIGGFSAHGGIVTKLRLLSIEAARSRGQTGFFEGDGVFDFDPEIATRHLRRSDPMLARVIDAAGPFRMQLKKTTSVFAALAEAIVHQQLSGNAAVTIFARTCALFPRPHEGLAGENILRVSDKKLRAAGLSRPKLLSLRDLAQKATAGRIPAFAEIRRMTDEAIIERLVEVRGIGRWTAEMLLIFRLGRSDVLPLGDYGIRKGYAIAFRKGALPTHAELAKRGERWRPYRTVASWYLWRAAELAGK